MQDEDSVAPPQSGLTRVLTNTFKKPGGPARLFRIERESAMLVATQSIGDLNAWTSTPEMTEARQLELHEQALKAGLKEQIDTLVARGLRRLLRGRRLRRSFRKQLKSEARSIAIGFDRYLEINVERFDGELWSDCVQPDCERDTRRHDMPFWPDSTYWFHARIQGTPVAAEIRGTTLRVQHHWNCLHEIWREADRLWPASNWPIPDNATPEAGLAIARSMADFLRQAVAELARARYPELVKRPPTVTPSINIRCLPHDPWLRIEMTLPTFHFTWREALLVKRAIARLEETGQLMGIWPQRPPRRWHPSCERRQS